MPVRFLAAISRHRLIRSSSVGVDCSHYSANFNAIWKSILSFYIKHFLANNMREMWYMVFLIRYENKKNMNISGLWSENFLISTFQKKCNSYLHGLQSFFNSNDGGRLGFFIFVLSPLNGVFMSYSANSFCSSEIILSCTSYSSTFLQSGIFFTISGFLNISRDSLHRQLHDYEIICPKISSE